MPAWNRVASEVQVTAGLRQDDSLRWQFDAAWALVRWHLESTTNTAYRDLLLAANCGVPFQSTDRLAWERLPIIDKAWLGTANYLSRPASDDDLTTVATSGSTSSQALLPATRWCADRGLGDNFLRALHLSGFGSGSRHWGIEHRLPRDARSESGSSISMGWLQRSSGDNALITTATENLDKQIRKAVAFQPETLSGPPGFLTEVARRRPAIDPGLVLYGGAHLGPHEHYLLVAAFPRAVFTAFYPTTDAGALGVSVGDTGEYLTFTETHLIEILDDSGHHVAVGQVGDVVVTQFDALAAPIVRYRNGDRAMFNGWVDNRLVLSGIDRNAEASIGATLIPHSDLRSWREKLAAVDNSVVAVQLVARQCTESSREQAVVRVIGGNPTTLASHALRLLDEFPQLTAEQQSGEIAASAVDFEEPPASLSAHWKFPVFVDERLAK